MYLQHLGGPRNFHADEMEALAAKYREFHDLPADAPLLFRLPPWVFWSRRYVPPGIRVEEFPPGEMPDTTIVAEVSVDVP